MGMIVDSSFILSGEYRNQDRNTCLYTSQRNFVEIFKEAMANEIKVIELTKRRNQLMEKNHLFPRKNWKRS